MCIGRLLSGQKGSPFSTWLGILGRFSVQRIARKRGWCWFTLAPVLGQMCACLVPMSTAPQLRVFHVFLNPHEARSYTYEI